MKQLFYQTTVRHSIVIPLVPVVSEADYILVGFYLWQGEIFNRVMPGCHDNHSH